MDTLPPPSASQAYCHVSALESGVIHLPDEMFMTPATPGRVTIAPSLSFLVRHSERPEKLVFDLGIRRDWENNPPRVVHWIQNGHMVEVRQSVVESLAKGGLSPDDIDIVCLSHCHHDHVGDPRQFPSSQFLVGAQAKGLFHPGFPADTKALHHNNLLPADRTTWLDPNDWPPLGPFPRALDLYEDGSVYVIDAPGHLPGHQNLLVRTSPDGGWLLMVGDSAHNWRLITGDADVAMHPDWPHGCVHNDPKQADEHIKRIRRMMRIPRVRVILAHDEPWYRENVGGSAFWPGQIPSL
ncbi:hypothetical protein PLEOSDRAFT_1046214 [Pleurotus ostreatus PC15]|uniref:Metallo-beta-lactamase domain-containing protein n=1 Tax=Pleurotus ostreatus (strain PC15) TaxID=1137138 RepID=A0A067NDF3_PLEO1|nr:hypothetical protein PLEOSDRAFT_1046214 [Pleurotus ostreatus PC15]